LDCEGSLERTVGPYVNNKAPKRLTELLSLFELIFVCEKYWKNYYLLSQYNCPSETTFLKIT